MGTAIISAADLSTFRMSQVEQFEQIFAAVLDRQDAQLALHRETLAILKQSLPVQFPDPPVEQAPAKIDALRPVLDDVQSNLGRLAGQEIHGRLEQVEAKLTGLAAEVSACTAATNALRRVLEAKA